MRQSDLELVRELQRGDPSACHRFVDLYANRLYGLAYSLLGNAEDAEDVVQETLSGALRGIGSFQQRSSLWTWLAKILFRQAARFRRSAGPLRMVSVQSQDESLHPAASSPVVGVDAKVDLAAALAKLTIEHREIVLLREVQDMSYDEIAEVLGIPIGTVESRLYRARSELRKLLSDWNS